ncbi:MAG: tRNA (adenosine(37)-N6)-threonylcarbamoyltransferase complex ATPase subunit type 1 TsaE, partial [Clostridiales bacterium]|nr:tRNA (adenosine(37)-N6)-threonylcarbamoyltransferase complex ATPase subunit type 1 TsaE [Clostridiales bacterium]
AGFRLGESLRGGEILALNGALGAGKTVFVKGLAAALGVTEPVLSPTFTLCHVYEGGRLVLCHFDCYRLRDENEALNIGVTDYLGQKDTVCVLEWGDRIARLLPADTIRVAIERIGETQREIGIDTKQ